MSDDDKNRLKHTKPKVGKDLAFESEVDSKDLQEIEANVRAEKALVERGQLSEREDLNEKGKADTGATTGSEAHLKADNRAKEIEKGKEKSERTPAPAEISEKTNQLDAQKVDRLQKDVSEAKQDKPPDERTSDDLKEVSKKQSKVELRETVKEQSKEQQRSEAKFDRPAIEESKKKPYCTLVEHDQLEVVEKKDLERVPEAKTELNRDLYETEIFSRQENKSAQIEKLDHILPTLEQVEVSQRIFQELKPLEIYIAARQDLEMVELVRQYAEVKPYEAVQELEGHRKIEFVC